MGVLGDRVWKLKQNSEEILYQVCGRREPCQDDTVKREPQEDREVRGDEKGKTGTIIFPNLFISCNKSLMLTF